MLRFTTLWALALLLLPGARAQAAEAPSELVWQDRFDLGGHRDDVRNVIVSEGYLITDGLSFLERGPNGGRRRSTHVSAYDLESGRLVWRRQLAASGGSALYVDRGLVLLIGWVDFSLRIWTFELATGEPSWEASGPPVESAITASVLVDGVLFSAGEWRPGPEPEFAVLLQARDARTGEVLWEDRGAGGSAVSAFGLAAQNGLLAVLTADGSGSDVITGYDAATGRVLWRRASEVSGERLISLEAAICRGRLFISSVRGERPFEPFTTLVVRGLSALTGDTLWERELESPSDTSFFPLGLHCAGPNAYVAAQTGSRNDDRDDLLSLMAFDRKQGATRWRHDFERDPIFGRLLKLEAKTVLMRVDDDLRVYSRRKGRLVWAANPFPRGTWSDVDLVRNGYLAVAAGIRTGPTKADAVVRVLR